MMNLNNWEKTKTLSVLKRMFAIYEISLNYGFPALAPGFAATVVW